MITHNNLKITKTMLFASLIVAMILPFSSTGMAFAFTDQYVRDWELKDKELMKIQDKIAENQAKIISIDVFDDISDEQYRTIDEITQLQLQEITLIAEIDALEQQSIESYIVSPETERKLLDAEQQIIDKYLDESSAQYMGENIVNFVMIDYQDEQLQVLIDAPSFDYDGNLVPIIIPDIAEDVSVDVNVEFGEFVEAKCRSRTANCSPMVGGISIAKAGQGLADDSSIGFKAIDILGNTGFVIAGHAADVNDYIYQKAGGTKVGQVIREVSSCDCAFVKSTKNMIDGIYKNSRQHYTIRDYAVISDFVKGTFLKKSGVATGITYGDLRDTTTGSGRVVVGTSVSSGDSGSPVFRSYGYNNAELFGIISLKHPTDGALMEKYPTIKTDLQLR